MKDQMNIPPASQPVAPALTKEQIEDIIQAVKTSMNFSSGFFFPRGWNVLLDKLNAMLAAPNAVAPSDAKGKADAANAGGVRTGAMRFP